MRLMLATSEDSRAQHRVCVILILFGLPLFFQ